MKIISQFIIAVITNASAIVISAYFIPDFQIVADIKSIAVMSLILTILNAVVKPILKFVLSPLIIITFGLILIAINGLILYILDIISPSFNILSIPALIYASLIFGFLNAVFHKAIK